MQHEPLFVTLFGPRCPSNTNPPPRRNFRLFTERPSSFALQTIVPIDASPVHALRQSHERVRASLASRSHGEGKHHTVNIRSWSVAQLTGTEKQDASVAWNFRDFEKGNLQEPARSAFPAPTSLPPFPSNVDPGAFPSLGDVSSLVGR